jgi:hypothetical protein
VGDDAGELTLLDFHPVESHLLMLGPMDRTQPPGLWVSGSIVQRARNHGMRAVPLTPDLATLAIFADDVIAFVDLFLVSVHVPPFSS